MYKRLKSKSARTDSYPITNDGDRHSPERNVSDAPTVSEKLWIDDRLLELCHGDRSQAEWLLHQLRRKHPGQSMDWYNNRAIADMS